MQTLREIRALLDQAGIQPRRRFGQNFLIDKNLMGKLLDLADLRDDQTILEVGAGTGSLTQELLSRAGRVVAVEVDRGLAAVLERRFAGESRLTLICADAMAGKHRIATAVLEALGARAQLVSNLPYNIATPLVVECLLSSWRAVHGRAGTLFERLTFTVQREVADKLIGARGGRDYGPASVLVGLLGRCRAASLVPPEAFWPRPNVMSRMVRIDFDPAAAQKVRSIETLAQVLRLAFGQRRKQIHSVVRRRACGIGAEAFRAALSQAGIDGARRAQQVSPGQFLTLANVLAEMDR